jgi:signal transduction histidine kinase
LTQAQFHVNVGDIGTVSDTIAEGLAAVAAEALTNAAKHADAKHISIALCARNDTISLKVGDDGRGFDWAAVRRRSKDGNGAGLLLMKAQIRLLGGELRIRSAPSKGTLVSALIPVNEQFAVRTHHLGLA